MRCAMCLISIWGVLTIPSRRRSLSVTTAFYVDRYVSNEYRLQGFPVRFVGNTIMEGNWLDRVRFALESTKCFLIKTYWLKVKILLNYQVLTPWALSLTTQTNSLTSPLFVRVVNSFLLWLFSLSWRDLLRTLSSPRRGMKIIKKSQ